MIYIKDNTINSQEIEKLKVFLTHPFLLWGPKDNKCKYTDISLEHELVKKVQNHVANDKRFNNVESAQIITYPTGVSKSFHLDGARETTTGTSVTFLNDDFVGGEPMIEGIKISPIAGRTYYIDGKMYQHAVLNVIKGSRHTLTVWYNDGKN